MGRLDEPREDHRPFGSTASISAPLTRLIGRASELEGVGAILRRARVVTLTGPAGVGKTRTAVELGWEVADEQRPPPTGEFPPAPRPPCHHRAVLVCLNVPRRCRPPSTRNVTLSANPPKTVMAKVKTFNTIGHGQEEPLKKVAGCGFYNVAPWTFAMLLNDDKNLSQQSRGLHPGYPGTPTR